MIHTQFLEPRRTRRTNRRFLLEPIALNYDVDDVFRTVVPIPPLCLAEVSIA
jgi:hypothetical protein